MDSLKARCGSFEKEKTLMPLPEIDLEAVQPVA
jgi:hypothetical protein